MVAQWPDDDILHITIWTEQNGEQIEISTKHGQSQIYRGEAALDLADWLRYHLPKRKQLTTPPLE